MAKHSKLRRIVRPLAAAGAALAVVVAGGPGAAVRAPVGAVSGSAATVSVLKDLTAAPASVGTDSVVVGGRIFFVQYGSRAGYLWCSDGTAAGTVRLHRFSHYTYFEVHDLTGFGGLLAFWVDAGPGEELWRSDGTTAGTVLVKDHLTTEDESVYPFPVVMGGSLYFNALKGIFRTDGTTAGTTLVKAVRDVGGMAAVDGTLYFESAGLPATRLWRSDGTTDGTVVVSSFTTTRSDATGQGLGELLAFNGRLAFTRWIMTEADEGEVIARLELWVSDGTAVGTRRLHSLPGGASDPNIRLMPLGSSLVFTDSSGGLWRSDGTAIGTARIYRTPDGWIGELAVGNGQLMFVARDGLYVSDGTGTGTRRILPTVEDTPCGQLTPVGSELYFVRDIAATGPELWVSDGTAAGTRLVSDLNPGRDGSPISTMADVNGGLFFIASVRGHGTSLWTTSAGGHPREVRLLDIGTLGSYVSGTMRIGPDLLFRAIVTPWDDENFGDSLWRTDGTSAGTVQLPLPMDASIENVAVLGERAFVSTFDGLSVIVGDRRTQLISDRLGWYAWDFTAAGAAMYFARSGESAPALWRSDGTVRGTRRVKTALSPTATFYGDAVMAHLTAVGSRLFFVAADGVHGVELWTSDGTTRGTHMVKNIRTGGPSRVAHLTRVGRTLYFTANDGKHGQELWKSDGTAAGTVMVRDIRSKGSSTPRYLTNVNGTLMFSANDGVHGRELWRSDGTRAGTRIVRDARPGTLSTWPGNLTAVGKTVFFTAYDFHGRELWVSDGTRAGTRLVKDIRPNERSVEAAPWRLTQIGDRLMFAARDATHGIEPWISDGTAKGTVMIADVNPFGSSWPQDFAYTHGKLVFDADDGTHGMEPMVVRWPV